MVRPQDITSFSGCTGVILVHSSSSLFHSSVTSGFLNLSHNFVANNFQSGLNQDYWLAISLFQCQSVNYVNRVSAYIRCFTYVILSKITL